MSKRQKIFDFINSRKASRDGWVKMTNPELAENIGMSVEEVQQIVGSLKATGNVDTLIQEGRVQGFKIVKAPSRWRRSSAAVAKAVKQRKGGRKAANTQKQNGAADNVIHLVRTPQIDRYGAAKETFERMISDEAVREHIEATWNPNPVAEEGLSLKQRYESLREELVQLRETYKEEHRALEYLRTARDETLREGLKNAGVMVEHGA